VSLKPGSQAACLWLVALFGCGTGPTEIIGVHDTLDSASGAGASGVGSEPLTDCNARAVVAGDPVDPFYSKLASAHGIIVMASALVDDEAVERACDIVVAMLAARSDVADHMLENGARVAVMGENEEIRELPELAGLSSAWQGERGAGATLERATTACAEENLLCLPSDVYREEKILVHSFAHSIRSLGIAPFDPQFDERLGQAGNKRFER
jgi:hypothetical protein